MCLGEPSGGVQLWNHRETMRVSEKIELHSPFRDLEVEWSGVCVVDEMRSWNRGRVRTLSPAGLCLLLGVCTERTIVGSTAEHAGDRGSFGCISPGWCG